VNYWVGVGARPSRTVQRLMRTQEGAAS
jgi:ribosomal protein S16